MLDKILLIAGPLVKFLSWIASLFTKPLAQKEEEVKKDNQKEKEKAENEGRPKWG